MPQKNNLEPRLVSMPDLLSKNKQQIPSWLRWLVIIGISWGIVLLIIVTINELSTENLTLAASILLAGLYTLVLFFTRQFWLPAVQKKPLHNAVLFAIFNAAFVETEFLVFEHLFRASGVAAHPNLLIDLLMTMPWYIGMVLIFVHAQKKHQYSWPIVLLLGGLYELGADGVIGGQIIPTFSGEQIHLLDNWIQLLLFAFWQFIPVYSSMVIVPAWILEKEQEQRIQNGLTVIWDAVKPIMLLYPFLVYLIGLLFVLNLFTNGV